MVGPLENKHVVLGVTGSIACYKAVDLASKLVQAGALVDTVMSYGATQFIAPLTFRAITHREVVTDTFDPHSELAIEHVSLAHTTTVIATTAPLLIAPAMDANMYDHPSTQENLAKLRQRGVVIAGPAPGRLASGMMGMGRLLETPELLGYISATLGRQGDLAGRTVVVSAGGTMEAIDLVRVITNHSSGKMGYALAEAARDRGANVVLVTAATGLAEPSMVNVVPVTSAQEMCDAVLEHVKAADALIMAAAVADYRPSSQAEQKIKKSGDDLSIALTKTTDILQAAKGSFVRVGFSAESQDLLKNAKAKVQSKDLDLIVANDITDPDSGFGRDTNKVALISRDLQVEELPVLSKYEVSNRVLDRVLTLFRS